MAGIDDTATSARSSANNIEQPAERINSRASDRSVSEAYSNMGSQDSRQNLASQSDAMTKGKDAALPSFEIVDDANGGDSLTRGAKNKGDKPASGSDKASKDGKEAVDAEKLRSDVVDRVGHGQIHSPGVQEDLQNVAQKTYAKEGQKGIDKLGSDIDAGMKKNFGDKAGFEIGKAEHSKVGDRATITETRPMTSNKGQESLWRSDSLIYLQK